MARIYVSSTSIDLEDYRKTVGEALRRLGHQDVAMDYYVAEDKRPVDRSLNDVASSDVYVGIFAYRYGFIPKENNPEGRSVTELEYRKAQEVGTPCLIFLLSDDAPWPTSKREKGEGAQKIETFRDQLINGEKHVVNFFETADELARKVNEAVTNWATERGLIAKRQLTNWDAYREAVINKHQWVRLQVIAGASKERGPVRIPLTEVFESQLATAGASGADVPDEVRKYQQVIYGLKADVPVSNDDAVPIKELLKEGEEEDPLLLGNPEQVLDLLTRERTQVILGGPGSGKSTILQYVMLRVCQVGAAREALPLHLQDAPIPFLIDLRSYVLQKAKDFPSYIVKNAIDVYDAPIEIDNLVAVLTQERQALVLFDGLDEVFDPDERRRVVNQFQSFAHRYPHARIVVTSRIAGYDRTALGLAEFEHYTLLPLTLGQIRHFAEQWYQYYTLEDTDRSAQGLVQRIIESPRLLDLAGNPLLLTMMAVIYKDRDLPNERWKLYERCAETLLEDWDLGKGIEDEDFKLSIQIRTAQKSEILQRVSMYMLEHGQKAKELNAIAYNALLDIVASYLEEKYQRPRGEAEAVAVDILRHLMERTYVLAGIGERIFGFVHRTFMEYFAACHCKEQFNKSKSNFKWLNRKIFGAHWNKSEWEEVLLLLIAMLHDQKTPIHEVIDHLRRSGRSRVPWKLAFAARCLGEAGDLQDSEQGRLVLEELAQTIQEGVSLKSRMLFVETALKSFASLAPLVNPPPNSVQKIIADLDDSPYASSRIAAWQMGFALRSRKERLTYALNALKDRDETVRRGAIAALEREWPGRADIGLTLTEIVRSDRQARVRQAALSAMQRSWRTEPAILDAISSRIDEETGYRNVIRLIHSLSTAWRGNQKALNLALKLTGKMPKARETYDYESVMMAAIPALTNGWAGHSEALVFLKHQATTHPIPQIRSLALQSISQGWTHNEGSLQFLKTRATDDPDERTRAAGLGAIARQWVGDPEALSYLQTAASRDPDLDTRAFVLSMIAQNWKGNVDALNFLGSQVSEDTDPKHRRIIFNMIASGWAGQPQAFSFFLKWIKNSDDMDLRVAALRAVHQGFGQTKQGFDLIRDCAVSDSDPRIRTISLGLVGQLIVQSVMRRVDPEVFLNQVRLLQVSAVQDPDLEVRDSVLRTFVGLPYRVQDYHGCENYILDFFIDRVRNDPEPRIRLRALKAIYQTRRSANQNYGELLNENLPFVKEQATSNPDAQARRIAIEVLVFAWSSDEALKFFITSAANDPEPSVRAAALRAIGLKTRRSEADVFSFLRLRAATDGDQEVRAAVKKILNHVQLDRGSET